MQYLYCYLILKASQIENTDINPKTYGQLIFNKEDKKLQ